MSEHNGLPRSILGSFLWVLVILLAWFTTGCPVLSSTLVDTSTGEVSLSVRGDEHELEEDVEQ